MLFRLTVNVASIEGDGAWLSMSHDVELFCLVASRELYTGMNRLYLWWASDIDHPIVFLEHREYEIWKRLSKITGIGPVLSARILRVLGVDGLVRVLATGDVSSLVNVKGVGNKLAKRVISELTDIVSSKVKVGDYEDVIDAFVRWGFKREEVKEAIQRLVERGVEDIDELLGELLRELAGEESK